MIAFGPIPSRRLGKSLGINNIVSRKQCPYNCVYCQVGATAKTSVLRREFYQPEILVNNVKQHLKKLDQHHQPNYLSLVANGEPSLDLDLGIEIQLLKELKIPVAVFTNSSLLDKAEVRNDLMHADWVSVKIDTVEINHWKKVNRPHPSINFYGMLDGLKKFTESFKGSLSTETMLVRDYNDSPDLLHQTASFIVQLKPQAAYLSIPTRPPAVKTIKAVSESTITTAWEVFHSKGIKTELLTGFEGTDTGYTGNIYEDILNITAVHPLRDDAMDELLRKDNADARILTSLINQGVIKKINHQEHIYYVRSYHY
jgi:wyosine [tRNA(Phe)-imidazoG37] synthetase (radical SAM superfamily)